MFVVAGLGNPGSEYAKTRHNVGFWAIDKIANDLKAWKDKFSCSYSKTKIASEEVLLVKPQKYMNRSGEALRPLLDYFKLELDKLIVIYDELDLDPGTMRIRKDGTAGGHNGVEDIIQAFSSSNFIRLRLGIGHPKRKGLEADVVNWVLSSPDKEDKEKILKAVELIPEAVETIIKTSLETAQQKYNGISF